MKYITKLKCSS